MSSWNTAYSGRVARLTAPFTPARNVSESSGRPFGPGTNASSRRKCRESNPALVPSPIPAPWKRRGDNRSPVGIRTSRVRRCSTIRAHSSRSPGWRAKYASFFSSVRS
jgi:hypothetical protein